MNPTQVSDQQIRERVLELVASVEQYARLTRAAITTRTAQDLATITVKLATELAELMGAGRLEVSRG